MYTCTPWTFVAHIISTYWIRESRIKVLIILQVISDWYGNWPPIIHPWSPDMKYQATLSTCTNTNQWRVLNTLAQKARYGIKGLAKNIIAWNIFVCECSTKLMVPMEWWSLKDLIYIWKKTSSSFTPSKLGKTPIFRGFSWIFQTCVTFFWLMLHVIPICHFEP